MLLTACSIHINAPCAPVVYVPKMQVFSESPFTEAGSASGMRTDDDELAGRRPLPAHRTERGHRARLADAEVPAERDSCECLAINHHIITLSTADAGRTSGESHLSVSSEIRY